MILDHIRNVTRATTTGRLYAFPGGFPALANDSSGSVVGEIIEFDNLAPALALLDAFEGDDLTRILKSAVETDGRAKTCWCYVLADASLVDEAEPIESGDWVEYCKST